MADGDDTEVTFMEQHQCWSNSQYAKFLEIFGDEKERKMGFKNPTLALKVVIDFCRENPSGKERRVVRKFSVSLSKYLHAEGFRQQTMDESGSWKVDFELFITHMKTARNWTPSRAQEFWDQQKNDLGVQRDEAGPPWSKLRLHMPSLLLGGDRSWTQAGSFEEKALSRESKPMKLGEDDIARIRAETGVGFKRSLPSASSASMATGLRPGSMTVEGGDEGRMALSSGELLQQAAQDFTSNKKAKVGPKPEQAAEGTAPTEQKKNSDKQDALRI